MKPEAVQFFQFDSQGNMFIFAPGAGCTGECKLVKPGDELIFNSTWQWDQQPSGQFMMQENTELCLVSSCPDCESPTSLCEFKEPLPKEALVDLSHKNFSAETMKKIKWVRKIYRDWHLHRHSLGLEFIPSDLEDKGTITGESLDHTLVRFITEVKKVNGED